MKEQNEKQAIEEMAKVIHEKNREIAQDCYGMAKLEAARKSFPDAYAEALYNAGCRKQSVGEWVTVGEGITERVVCSNCNSEKGSFMKPPFCNQCGARMKGGAE